MRQTGEPSVEEILESIKKVIARDNSAEAAQSRPKRETALQASQERPRVHDVLELTEVEGEALQEQPAGGQDDGPSLIDPQAVASMRDSLAALAVLSEPGVQPQIVRSGETSLEGLTRELLRPMLAEWLDQNLPAMVERLVAVEIARIAGKKG